MSKGFVRTTSEKTSPKINVFVINKVRYLKQRHGSIMGFVDAPIGFKLGMVGIRSDGWVALVDQDSKLEFISEFTEGLEWKGITDVS